MDKAQIRETIARRAAKELHDGYVVNLGIGLPTMIPAYLTQDVKVTIHSENGLLGLGPRAKEGEEDWEYTDAGGSCITATPGAATFNSAYSFGLVRGGHVDVTILGALQTDEQGNLANWCIPGKKTPGMGGAMDLLSGARRVILAMEHTAKGNHKILKECTLPLTAAKCVNLIITEMGVMEVTDKGLVLREYNPAFTLDEIKAATGCELIVDENLIEMC